MINKIKKRLAMVFMFILLFSEIFYHGSRTDIMQFYVMKMAH